MPSNQQNSRENGAILLSELFETATRCCSPSRVVPIAVENIAPPKGRTIVVGAGKASAAMATAFDMCWDHPIKKGLVVTRYGHSSSASRIPVCEASHPIPDRAGLQATSEILEIVSTNLTKSDLVVVLLSGGGSALLALPVDTISFEEKRNITEKLLRSGADISEMNCVRKHFSKVKGGRLYAACQPARVITMSISDVIGDNPSVIASGPTVPDPSTRHEAIEILRRYDINVSLSAWTWLNNPTSETPKEFDSDYRIIASPSQALSAAEEVCSIQGIQVINLGADLGGDAQALAKQQATFAKQVADSGWKGVILSGGETTVKVSGSGVGGRNVQYLGQLAVSLRSDPRISAIAADTDGIDGIGTAAGAVIDPSSLERANSLGLSFEESLRNNDCHSLFKALKDQVVTGPTFTNVNDFRAMQIQ